jgi:DNA-binding MarR family transcriptional regulator
MRSIPVATPDSPPDDVDAILTEVGGWVGDLRCTSMGHLVQAHVSMAQLHVLWLLQHHGEMPMSRLAELMGVSLSNATGLIDRMEDHGLIERLRVPDDRRLVMVRPAAAGLRALSETETSKRDRMRSVIARLGPAERSIVLSAFRSLRRALSAEIGPDDGHRHHFSEPS